MRWTVHGERTLYDSDWLRLTLVDVEPPGGERYEHHVVRVPRPAAATVVRDPERGVLMLWRHRFVVDAWGWEIPGGEVDADETPVEAAVRETVEETGWRPGPIRELGAYHPFSGRTDHTFHVFVADGAEEVGAPVSPEAERVEWVTRDEVVRFATEGGLVDGYSLTALCWAALRGEL